MRKLHTKVTAIVLALLMVTAAGISVPSFRSYAAGSEETAAAGETEGSKGESEAADNAETGEISAAAAETQEPAKAPETPEEEALVVEEAAAPMLAVSGLDPKLYWGYKDSGNGFFYYPLYVLDDDGPKVAYCYNAVAEWPAGPPADPNSEAYINTAFNKGYMFYKIKDATAQDMNNYSVVNNPNMKASVLKVIYNGYPYNSSGIKQKYGLNNMRFREVTQAAIWKYTDAEGLDIAMEALTKNTYAWSADMKAAYADLIGTGTTRLVTPPDDFQLDLFISQTQTRENIANPQYGYYIQNLLAVRLGDLPDEEMDLHVKKTWVGTTPDVEIEVLVYANNHLYTNGFLNADNGWELTFTGLPKSDNITYTIDEVAVPGYTKKITGTAKDGFTITNTQIVINKNITVSKIDIGGVEIADAKMEIRTPDGAVKDKWTSKAGESHEASLAPGEYTLVETAAPGGYVVANAVKFKLAEDGSIQVYNEETQAYEAAQSVVMVDEYADQKVKVSKRDIGGEEIEGASIEIRDKNHAVKDQWTSEAGKTHESVLQPGEYTLIETAAPGGYVVANNVKFSVDHTGTVKVYREETQTYEAVETVVMVDEYADQKVKVSKRDIGGEEIEGASIEIRDKNNAVKDQWTSEAGKTHESELQPGEYTLIETAAPDGYVVANNVKFSVDHTGTVKVYREESQTYEMVETVVMVDEYKDQLVKISKTNISGQEIAGAKLVLKDKAGAIMDQWTSEADVVHEVLVQPGEYTLIETAAPAGYKIAESITFTVDKDGVIRIGKDTVKRVVMVDKYENPTEKPKGSNGGEGLKTGDSRFLGVYAVLMLLSLLAIFAAAVGIRRNERR